MTIPVDIFLLLADSGATELRRKSHRVLTDENDTNLAWNKTISVFSQASFVPNCEQKSTAKERDKPICFWGAKILVPSIDLIICTLIQ
jgi:hypothetical protein